jgi:cell division protein FtsB
MSFADRVDQALERRRASVNEIAALRARVEALEAFVQDLADESCLDRGGHRNQEVCAETNLRLIDYCGPCRARALLEKIK